MLIPIEPMPVAIAAAVVVVVLIVALVAVDEADMPVALVEVVSVVAVDSIVMPDMPDIVPMSMPDISMLGLLLEFRNEWKVVFRGWELWFAGCHPARRAESVLKAESRSDWTASGPVWRALVPWDKGRRSLPPLGHA